MTNSSHDRTLALRAAKIQFGDALAHALLEAGKPSYREMLRRGFSYSPATITRALRGDTLPKWDFVDEFLRLCDVNRLEIEQYWRPRWVEVAALTKSARTDTAFTTDNGTGRHDPSVPIGIECPTCGAWVINTDRHKEWHSAFTTRQRWLRLLRAPGEAPNSRQSMLG